MGKASEGLAAPGAPYDMIFIDGDHGRAGALHDSCLAWHLLSNRGVIFWHDYQIQDYFVHPRGAVPEALQEFQVRTAARIVSLEGTTLALYSRYPGWETLKVAGKKTG